MTADPGQWAAGPPGPDEPAPAMDLLRADAPDWARLAARVEAAAAPELARRAAAARPGGGVDLTAFLARALRPALAAAAAALVVAVGLTRATPDDSAPDTAVGEPALLSVGDGSSGDPSVAQALSVRDPSAPWIVQGRAPTPEALGQAIGVEAAP